MKITKPLLDGIILIEPKRYHDDRGYFYETFQQIRYEDLGILPFVQDNMSRSKQHVLRGLHYQLPNPQGKLVWVGRGAVLDVVVDLRKSSPTFGEHFSLMLSDENALQMYVPPGFAHGFCVLSNEADFYYKCTEFYTPSSERGIKWNDPHLTISWPTEQPIVSSKDQLFPALDEVPRENLPA